MRQTFTIDRTLIMSYSRLHHTGSKEGGAKEARPRQGAEDAHLGKEIEMAQKLCSIGSHPHNTILVAKWIFRTVQPRLYAVAF